MGVNDDFCFAHRCPVSVCVAAQRGCQARSMGAHPSSVERVSLREEFALEDPRDLLVALVDHTPCDYDRDGACRVHRNDLRPFVCANGAAREYLRHTQVPA